MFVGKPPVVRKRAGGFPRLHSLIFIMPAVLIQCVLSIPSVSAAPIEFSVGPTVYDYYYNIGGFQRLTGQAFTVVWNDGDVSKGFHFETAGLDVAGFKLDCTNMGLVLEKSAHGVLAGVGLGFVDTRQPAPTPPLLSFICDIYGKATILSIGKNSLRGFVTARTLNPTPFGTMTVYNTGVEVCLVY
jgi:hypothetical protein